MKHICIECRAVLTLFVPAEGLHVLEKGVWNVVYIDRFARVVIDRGKVYVRKHGVLNDE